MPARSLDAIPVVTVFLYRRGKVLLLRRSDRVSTYRGHWAGVAGYLERLPIEQARLEMREEAGVRRDDVSLKGIGCPLIVPDPSAGRTWLVFTFLFGLKDGVSVRTDWETAEAQWVCPAEVGRLETVPGLAEGLARVWPPWGGGRFWRAMEEVATDTTSGATGLAIRGLRLVSHLAGESRRRGLLAYAALHPSMGIFPHLAARALGKGVSLRELAQELDRATGESAGRAAALLRPFHRLLTHSASRACREALLRWWRPGREVVVTESRPKREGVSLARDLARAGLKVTLIADAAASVFVPRCDAVLVGADAITDDDQLINKAGTRLMACAAREAGAPCFAVAQTHKIAPANYPLALCPQEPRDLATVGGVRVTNVAFDATPLSWFSQVVTERGPLAPALLGAVRRRLGDWDRWLRTDHRTPRRTPSPPPAPGRPPSGSRS
ncbi:MAG: NUDIX domain-containing protein [Armatimonadota bacterium]